MGTLQLSSIHDRTFSTMAKLQELSYIVDVDEVALLIGLSAPTLETHSISALTNDIRQSALMHACAWLSSDGIFKWKFQSPDQNIHDLNQSILAMTQSFRDTEKMWQLNTRHQMPTAWAIEVEQWSMAVSVFAFKLADIILSQTEGLVQYTERFNEHTLFFTPQRIHATGNGTLFAFKIALFNRELLPAQRA